MGKLSGGCKDQGCLDSGLLPTPLDLVAWLVQEWHCLFPVPAMVQETCQRSKYCSRIGTVYPNGISTVPKSISASNRRFKDESGLRQYSVQQRAEGISATYRLRAKYSDLMVQALNYMLNSWDELQTYRKDGRYTIDNLPAERAIRPFTVSRKNLQHYSALPLVPKVSRIKTMSP